ncbi:MAG: NUDIX domain-containing protein [Dehalococcoidia bacterium]
MAHSASVPRALSGFPISAHHDSLDTGFRVSDFLSTAVECVSATADVAQRDSPAAGVASCFTQAPCRPSYVARCIAEFADSVVLCQRKDLTRQGLWSLPGGFTDIGESVGAAARRELHEETGLTATNPNLFRIYVMPQISQTVCIFRCAVLAPNIIRGSDELDVKLFPRASLPWSRLAFPSDHLALCASQEKDDHVARLPVISKLFWGADQRILVRGLSG